MLRFFKCDVCGKVVAVVNNGAGTSTCCGQNMRELIAGSTDASAEKHVPSVKAENQQVMVNVGSIDHPMQPEHYIQWICIETDKGFQLKYLTPGSNPSAVFNLEKGEKLKTVYSYCNLHGLWNLLKF